jgi:small subunit ribosomal protein S1
MASDSTTPAASSPVAASTGAGPLARFTRPNAVAPPEQKASEQTAPEQRPAERKAEQSPPADQPAAAAPPSSSGTPATAPIIPPGQQGPPRGFRPRGRGDRPKSRREKEQDENRQVDAELAREREATADRGGPRGPVPVPNRRQRSEEIEAELEAALGGMSLEDIVAGDLKTTAQQLETGSKHRAQVVDLHGDDVFFSLGGKNQGVSSVRNFVEAPKPGDMVDVLVTGYNGEDNLYLLSIPGGSVVSGDWSDISDGSIVEARVTGANTGGLECQVNNLRAFIPVSQISLYRTENPADYIGQKLVCVVTEANERRGNLVLSRRAVLEREKEESKKSLMAELQPGQMREGTVRKLHDFGAFVDLGGVDGLIHISQLAWDRVKHPSEVVQEGQKVRVRVEKIDEATGKISLSLKNPEEHPWTNIGQRIPAGSTVRGPVTRLAQFGAFVKLAPGVEGLIHISELAHHKVYKVENVVKEGQEVECKVLEVDPEAQRISLSLKAAIAKPEKATDANKSKEEPEEPPRELAVPKRSGPLRGGIQRKGGGEQFGLKW